ncbi:MAG TPA: 50S ribosomal protein L4 [Patescibacteria group bacterium]|nr:50S ribosomal protein L4 [bacterium]HRY56667.1 50S ribosomal protein L4 [Patescibacteria group bacterium]
MKVDVINLKGEKLEQIDLRDEIFGSDYNPTVLAQYIRVYQNNQRQGTSSTKTRAEVSGGGLKPRAQKGSGRSRQGSIRSPIWVGGGVAHGPKPKSYKSQLSKKMKGVALSSALSTRMKEGKVIIIDGVDIKKPNTKEFSQSLKKIKVSGSLSLVWLGENENMIRSARNIPEVNLVNVKSLGAYDVMRTKNIVFLKNAVLDFQERFSK